jgi:hypothetical protein
VRRRRYDGFSPGHARLCSRPSWLGRSPLRRMVILCAAPKTADSSVAPCGRLPPGLARLNNLRCLSPLDTCEADFAVTPSPPAKNSYLPSFR